MIQVSQLAEFDFYKNFRLAAGKKGWEDGFQT